MTYRDHLIGRFVAAGTQENTNFECLAYQESPDTVLVLLVEVSTLATRAVADIRFSGVRVDVGISAPVAGGEENPLPTPFAWDVTMVDENAEKLTEMWAAWSAAIMRAKSRG